MQTKYIVTFLCIFVVLFGAFVTYVHYRDVVRMQHAANAGLPMKTITIGTTQLQVEIASTPEELEQGLSDRPSLAVGHGMLFVFLPPKPVGFWMKGMQFSLDLVFADSNGVITKIDTDVSPDSYPTVFPSDAPTMYVLEVPAGYTKKAGIATGAKIVVQ